MILLTWFPLYTTICGIGYWILRLVKTYTDLQRILNLVNRLKLEPYSLIIPGVPNNNMKEYNW